MMNVWVVMKKRKGLGVHANNVAILLPAFERRDLDNAILAEHKDRATRLISVCTEVKDLRSS